MNKNFLGINFKALGIISIVLLPLIFYSLFKRGNLKKNKKTTIGIVLDYNYSDEFSSWLIYKYNVNKIEYKNEATCFITYRALQKLIKHKISYLVLYDSLNPQNSAILISHEDYDSYTIPFPDSMNYR
jgi:hypothetical protein